MDQTDVVWLTDFTANAVLRFDPRTEAFTVAGSGASTTRYGGIAHDAMLSAPHIEILFPRRSGPRRVPE